MMTGSDSFSSRKDRCQMLDRIRRMGYPAFLRISLIAAFIVFTVKDLVSYARYTGAVSSGKVSELSVSLDECETLSMKKLENGAYAATDPDSQIIITADRPVAAVRLDMTTYLEPGENGSPTITGGGLIRTEREAIRYS